jgi:hypothetical protein
VVDPDGRLRELGVANRRDNRAHTTVLRVHLFHPLLPFNGEGDCLAAELRPANVHSAEGWEAVLLPETERQQQMGKEGAFRGDAAFARPEVYEALQEGGVNTLFAFRPTTAWNPTSRSCCRVPWNWDKATTPSIRTTLP